MAKTTELVSLSKDKSDDPRYSVCYARGSVFKKEGHFHRVEKGKRALVSKALCIAQYYGDRCTVCPNSQFVVGVRSGNP